MATEVICRLQRKRPSSSRGKTKVNPATPMTTGGPGAADRLEEFGSSPATGGGGRFQIEQDWRACG
jgi:hypothetical protein